MPVRFSARIKKVGTFFCVDPPAAASRELGGARGCIPVTGRAGARTRFASTLMPLGGGRHRLYLNGEVRAAVGGVEAGDRVDITLAVDRTPREREVPPDLEDALDAEGVRDAFLAMTRSRRNEILRWIDDAAQETTRERRIGRAVEAAHAAREKMPRTEGPHVDRVRSMALSLPDMVEKWCYGTPAFRVKNKLVARMLEDGESVVLRTPIPRRRELLSAEPAHFAVTPHYASYPMVIARASEMTDARLRAALEEAHAFVVKAPAARRR